MSRMENKAVMGYFAIEPKHHPAILSLVAPATPAHKLLDPYAGEGEFLEVAAMDGDEALLAFITSNKKVLAERFVPVSGAAPASRSPSKFRLQYAHGLWKLLPMQLNPAERHLHLAIQPTHYGGLFVYNEREQA